MASLGQQGGEDSDDGMDAFMDKFKTQKYKNGFNESTWEEEFDKIPMFMKKAPADIDPASHPDLACIQSIIHDDDRTPEEKAQSLKAEGNEYFKEKNYKRAIVSYSEGLKINCTDSELHVVLYTNRAAAHFHLGNMRSALNDAVSAKKLKPNHLKALLRGAQCCMQLRNYGDALQWCDEGLSVDPTDKKLQELRRTADKQKREAERDARKAMLKEKKQREQTEALLAAIKERGVKLLRVQKPARRASGSEDEEEGDEGRVAAGVAELVLDRLVSKEATGERVFLDENGALHWPVLFLYPEHRQTDFISAFCETSNFLDHLVVMFGEELPAWDTDRKYLFQNLQLFFEEAESEQFHQVAMTTPLLKVLQHSRYTVKDGTPCFIVMVTGSPFSKQFLSGKKVYWLK
ncbi:tetratricopeptide repeat protein 4 [Alosa sapidissima]|uniref:tetratricopeptide repeat protein 4 n=1 Tax=Alosa sapidissima TaxID=34773 RepID=UPI001C08A2B0|nr:tetratricopeptide repeat protein 4 [Alosa sapidissima]